MSVTTLLSRSEQQSVTRERLVEAATRICLERGVHKTSIAEIAGAAGFTTGAVYSNFASKEDLVLAVLDRREAEQVQGLARALSGSSDLPGRLRGVAEWFRGIVTDDPEWTLLDIEMTVSARNDERLRTRLLERRQAMHTALTAMIAQQAEEFHVELARPPGDIAAAILALGEGLVMAQLADPDRAGGVFEGALYALLGVDPSHVSPTEGDR